MSLLASAQTQLKIATDIRGHACAGGFGLCSNTTITEKLSSNVSAQKLSEKIIVFLFDKAGLSLQNQESMAGKAFSSIASNEKIDFIQEADLIIDPKTIISLGFDPKYSIIKKGVYPMTIDSDKVLVTFTLFER
jgi:hypothetical protein